MPATILDIVCRVSMARGIAKNNMGKSTVVTEIVPKLMPA